MESLVNWYQSTLGGFLPKEVFVFIVSMLPVIELRGGLVAASLLQIPLLKANVICILGNVLPVPFILLFLFSGLVLLALNGVISLSKGELGQS